MAVSSCGVKFEQFASDDLVCEPMALGLG